MKKGNKLLLSHRYRNQISEVKIMSKKKRKVHEPEIRCIAYLSVTGNENNTEMRERKQLRYIKEYAASHNIKITKIMHKDVLGQRDVNLHFERMTSMIREGFVDGIIVANTMSVSNSITDVYMKAGRVAEAGGVMVSVDEGKLLMKIVGYSYGTE